MEKIVMDQQPSFSEQPQPLPSQPAVSDSPKSKKGKIILIIVGVIVVLLAAPFVIIGIFNAMSGGGAASNELFNETLSNASQQTKAQQLTSYKLWKAGQATSSDPARHEVTLSEFDSTSKEFNTVNADTNLGGDAERCLKDKAYRYPVSGTGKDMESVLKTLNDPASERRDITADNAYSPCNLTRGQHVGKFSDGIIPVGITAKQALSWLNYIKAKELFVVKDEGKTQYKGKDVRKLGFSIADTRDTSNLFSAVRDGDTGKTGGSGINWQLVYGQQMSQNLATPTGLKGFYLIDEKTKLPVYGEFNSTVPTGKQAAQLETFAQKVEYAYPEKLSITETTKLSNF